MKPDVPFIGELLDVPLVEINESQSISDVLKLT